MQAPTIAPFVPTKDVLYEFSKARTRLVTRAPFFGFLAMQMRPRLAKPEDGCPTAGIAQDGSVILNAEFCDPLTDKEMAGLVAHEVMHPGLNFWLRKKSRHHKLFNIAHDLSFNPIVMEMAKGEITLPKGAPLDEKFEGMGAEEIYSYLLKGDVGTPGITKCKTHNGPEITIDVNQPDGGGGSDTDQFEDCRGDLADSDKGQKAAKGDTAAQKELEGEWKLNLAQAAQEHEKRKGTLPAGLKRYLDEILHPKLEWDEVLARWVGENGTPDDYAYTRPSRRSESVGSYLPSISGAGKADVAILVDTSGSIPQERLKRVLGETQGICESLGVEIRAMVVDAALHDDLNIEDAMSLAAKLKGGGGSDFNPAFDKLFEDGFDGAVIAFTDGMISVPAEIPVNLKGVLWITDNTENPPCPWGDHLQVGTGLKDE